LQEVRCDNHMSVRKKDDPALYDEIEKHNLLRQYDLLSNCIQIGLCKGIEAFDKYTLWSLNHAAFRILRSLGGVIARSPSRSGITPLRILRMFPTIWIDSFP
jgi:hypothetical protein